MNRLIKWLQEKLPLIIPFGGGGTIVLFMFLTFFDYFEPYLYPLHMVQGKARTVSEQSIVGPYPREAEIIRLKTKFGVTHIVSLLDAPNLPQEKALLEKEQKLCEKHHLHLLSYPLSYFSLDNPDNQKTMHALLSYIKEHPQERFYIHCYLGKHRVGKMETLLKAAK